MSTTMAGSQIPIPVTSFGLPHPWHSVSKCRSIWVLVTNSIFQAHLADSIEGSQTRTIQAMFPSGDVNGAGGGRNAAASVVLPPSASHVSTEMDETIH